MYFNPRAPCGARRPPCPLCPAGPYFNPRAPCGARRTARRAILAVRGFQSTRPVWGATPAFAAAHVRQRHFNPRAPCGARLGQTVGGVTYYNISIHAPRVGRDDEDDWPRMQAWPISIHAPRVGRDSGRLSLSLPLYLFQSTRPVWGATARRICYAKISKISIHAPRVGRDAGGCLKRSLILDISIHAPRVGRDKPFSAVACCCRNFNPRAPCGARPHGGSCTQRKVWISIHAPRVGRDPTATASSAESKISIHAPRVGRDAGRYPGYAWAA